MYPENIYVDNEEEMLLNDPDFIDVLSSVFDEDELNNNDSDNEILKEFGY